LWIFLEKKNFSKEKVDESVRIILAFRLPKNDIQTRKLLITLFICLLGLTFLVWTKKEDGSMFCYEKLRI